MTAATTLPSAAIDPATLDLRRDELVETLQALIRIPSINPPPADAPDGERRAADWIAGALADAGLRPELLELVPGRGSVVARLRGDGTGGEPLLLLGHLDVVPAAAELWSHDPFGGEIADGQVWGRGAVDMKHLVAMELTVVRMLAAEARAAGRDPAADPIPGLTRDVILASDRRRGGRRPQRDRLDHRRAARSCSGRRPRSTNRAPWRRPSRVAGSTRSASRRRATRSTG